MASPSSFSVFSDIPSSSEVGVTREEFNAFHRIDRTLFTRLVFGLNRDVEQTSRVLAFLYLLEQIGCVRNLIAYLVSLQDDFINAMANEVAVCVGIVHNEDYSRYFAVNNNNDESFIPLLLRLTGGRLTLTFINQNRQAFLHGVNKNLDDVCNRAFEDLRQEAERCHKEKLLAIERDKAIEEMKKMRLNGQQQSPGNSNVQQRIPTTWSMQQQAPIRLNVQHGTPVVQQGMRTVQLGSLTVPLGIPREQRVFSNVQIGTPVVQRQRAPTPPDEEVTNKSATETNEAENEEGALPADDRTVFLTFSKGYPVSESEVRSYFTRRYGDVIEAVLMQEVEESGQPLFARMVLKIEHATKMEEIVSFRNRNKFTIDGKHVCARKYVRNILSSSASPSSSSSYV